jgi:S1-C subfamily serine protease
MQKVSLRMKVLAVFLVLVLAGCSVPAISIQLNPSDTSTTTADSQPQPVSVVEKPVAITQASGQTLTNSEAELVALYERVNPSVVNIRVVVPSTSALDQLPNTLPNTPTTPQDAIPDQAEGSGFVLSADGYIVTNNHVVDGATRVIVTFSDGTEAEAKIIGTDPYSDLAVIKVEVTDIALTPLALGDSEALKVGQTVIAIGNPYNLNNSMTTGIISGLGRMLAADSATIGSSGYSIPNVIQTDAAINPGNSGGPLFNLQGEVIGINTAIESPVRANSGVGYAVPSALISRVTQQLIEKGKVEHAWLGIRGGSLNGDLAKAMGLDINQRGILVTEVVADSPASKAGLKGSTETVQIDGLDANIGGDIITAINGQSVRVFDDLLGYILTYTSAGDKVTLDIIRDGKAMQVEVALEARP